MLSGNALSVPPTPMPTTASSDANAMKLGEPPAERPKTPVRNRVRLKHHLTSPKNQKKNKFPVSSNLALAITHRLPQTSQPKLQNTVPTSKPALAARLRNGALKVNSSVTGARMRPVINYFGNVNLMGRNRRKN